MVPGDPEASRLLRALRYDGPEMPPDGKLPDSVIADFETWIRGGAPDPREASSGTADGLLDKSVEGGPFWAFQPPGLFDVPGPSAASTGHGRLIDGFILSRLEAADLGPAQEAERHVLIRRLTFDLTGLPPDLVDVETFENDPSPLAYERVVARILASPSFGERWARLWLDVARYAEDQAHIVGNNKALFYPNAFLYRDWVVAAFNAGCPV